MTTAELNKRWTLSFTPKNSDLSFLFFGLIYFYLVAHTGFPFSVYLLQKFTTHGAMILFGVFILAVPIVILKALIYGGKHGWGTLREGPVWMELLQPYFTLDFVFITVRRIIIILGAIFLFLHLKHLLLWWHPANFDLEMWNLDRAIHFGVQPNIWAMETFGKWHEMAVFLDWTYMQYFTFKLIVCVVFLMEPRGRKLSDQFFFAYQLVWFVGGLSYLVAPTDGPVYAVLGEYSIPKGYQSHYFQYPIINNPPKAYADDFVEAKIYTAKYYHETLWIDRQNFLAGKQLPGVFYGIAAMPSLHNAAVWMLTIFLFRASVFAGIAGALYCVIIFFGSIFLQWHYAVDGYAGMLLALACCWTAFRLPEIAPLIGKQLRRLK